MKVIKAISGLLAVFIVMPIWYYLMYKLLQGVNATDVMWLLYWIYLPVAIFVQILTKLAEAAES